jgi:hypothetical protein
LVTSRSQLP